MLILSAILTLSAVLTPARADGPGQVISVFDFSFQAGDPAPDLNFHCLESPTHEARKASCDYHDGSRAIMTSCIGFMLPGSSSGNQDWSSYTYCSSRESYLVTVHDFVDSDGGYHGVARLRFDLSGQTQREDGDLWFRWGLKGKANKSVESVEKDLLGKLLAQHSRCENIEGAMREPRVDEKWGNKLVATNAAREAARGFTPTKDALSLAE